MIHEISLVCLFRHVNNLSFHIHAFFPIVLFCSYSGLPGGAVQAEEALRRLGLVGADLRAHMEAFGMYRVPALTQSFLIIIEV